MHITVDNLKEQWPTLSREQQAETVLALQQGGMTRIKIAAAAGIKPRTVQTRLADAKSFSLAGTIPTGSIDVEVDRALIISDELDRRDRTIINKEARTLITQEYALGALRDDIAKLLAEDRSAYEAKILQFKNRTMEVVKKLSEKAVGIEAAIQHVSDLHYCRFIPGVIDESVTAGALRRYQDTCAELLARTRRHAIVKKLYLLWNGDNMHGTENFKSQSREVTGGMSYQISRTAWLAIDHINRERTQYEEIEVVVLGGNHGRKAKGDDLAIENCEFETGRIIEAYFHNSPDVKVTVVEGNFYHIQDILGRRFLVTHGDQIQGAGNPQAIIDAVKRWDDVLPVFDDALMGHFHRQMSLPLPRKHGSHKARNIYLGGTASLDDRYLETFGSSPSLQYQFLFTNGKRVTSRYDVDLYE